jgi:hypothetical protein
MFLRTAPKCRKRREKRASKILVYGFIVARVNQKSKPWIAPRRFFNRGVAGACVEIRKKNQSDSAKGLPLNPAARGFRLYYT